MFANIALVPWKHNKNAHSTHVVDAMRESHALGKVIPIYLGEKVTVHSYRLSGLLVIIPPFITSSMGNYPVLRCEMSHAAWPPVPNAVSALPDLSLGPMLLLLQLVLSCPLQQQ